MKLKNRPRKYMKRAHLPGRLSRVKKVDEVRADRKPEGRDLTAVEVDSHFYFTFRPSTTQGNR
jgi:hypothetical protein